MMQKSTAFTNTFNAFVLMRDMTLKEMRIDVMRGKEFMQNTAVLCLGK